MAMGTRLTAERPGPWRGAAVQRTEDTEISPRRQRAPGRGRQRQTRATR